MGSRVYIGRLSYQAREKDIERFFRGYGRIREINLKNGFGFVEFDDSRDADDAVYELNGKELEGERVIIEHARGPARGRDDRGGGGGYSGGGGGGGGGGRDSYRRGGSGGSGPSRRYSDAPRGRDMYGPPVRTDYRVVVENLSSRVSWQDLKDYMRQAGEVTFADAHKQHRNEGIVEFATGSDMKNAMEKLDGTEINGRTIKMVQDKPRSRHRSRSRSRSRSRRRSRSARSSRSRSRSRSHKSRSRSKSKSRSKSRSKSKSHSRSKSPVKRSSRSHSKSPRQRSSSPVNNHKSKSRSRSRSKSATPDKDD